MRAWTKQSAIVLDILESEGRYVAKRKFVKRRDENDFVVGLYDWLARNHPGRHTAPSDAEYPVWLSLSEEATMGLTPGTVLLELEIPDELIFYINVVKWTAIMNRLYIPADEADEKRHRELMKSYRQSDATAYQSTFYPQLKKEIEDSWIRLFDDSVGNKDGLVYGNVWQLKKEWLVKVTKAE